MARNLLQQKTLIQILYRNNGSICSLNPYRPLYSSQLHLWSLSHKCKTIIQNSSSTDPNLHFPSLVHRHLIKEHHMPSQMCSSKQTKMATRYIPPHSNCWNASHRHNPPNPLLAPIAISEYGYMLALFALILTSSGETTTNLGISWPQGSSPTPCYDKSRKLPAHHHPPHCKPNIPRLQNNIPILHTTMEQTPYMRHPPSNLMPPLAACQTGQETPHPQHTHLCPQCLPQFPNCIYKWLPVH